MSLLKRAISRVPLGDRAVTLLKHPRLLSANFDPSNTVYLAGAGRSGTTWLANIINYDNRYRGMDEPFRDVRQAADRFAPALYLRPADADPYYLEAAKTILSGRVGNRRVDTGNRHLFRRHRLIKEIRGHLWLKWLRNHFPEMPIMFLMRHPFAVVTSRMDLRWPTFIPQYLAQADLMEDHLEPLRAHMKAARSDLEKHLLTWCIQHYVPLRQLSRGDVHVIFYENVCVDTASEIERLFAFLGRPFSVRAVQSAALPSKSNWRDTMVGDSGADGVRGWQRRLTREEVRQSMRILELFGIDAVYDDQPLPKVKDLNGLLKPPSSSA